MMLRSSWNRREATVVVVLTAGLLLSSSFRLVGQGAEWTNLGHSESEDVTGQVVVLQHEARVAESGASLLRTIYPEPRYTADGEAWNVKYLTALMDCDDQTMTLIRIDYYSPDGEYVTTTNLEGMEAPVHRLEPGGSWAELYAFTCHRGG